jgi:hypothetical protein
MYPWFYALFWLSRQKLASNRIRVMSLIADIFTTRQYRAPHGAWHDQHRAHRFGMENVVEKPLVPTYLVAATKPK